MEEELKYLNYILDKYNGAIDDSNLKLNNLKKLYKYDCEDMLEEKFKLKVKLIKIFAI